MAAPRRIFNFATIFQHALVTTYNHYDTPTCSGRKTRLKLVKLPSQESKHRSWLAGRIEKQSIGERKKRKKNERKGEGSKGFQEEGKMTVLFEFKRFSHWSIIASILCLFFFILFLLGC